MKTRKHNNTGRSLLLWLAVSVVGVGLFVMAGGQNVAWAQEPSQRVSPLVVNRLAAGQPQDLMVRFDDAAIEAEAAGLRGAAAVPHDTPEILAVKAARYTAQKGEVLSTLPPGEFDTLRDYSHLPMAFIRFRSANALARLLERFDVVAVQEDEAHRPFLTQSLPLIGQPAVVAAGKIGTGTTVAVLDTGVVYTRSAFGSCTSPGAPATCKVIYAQDFTPTDDGALDDMLHGTNVSGIVLGVAPDTRIAALDVFRTDGFAYTSDLTAAINWSISNKATYNIVAMNMSLGGGGFTTTCTSTLTTAIGNARTAGILTAVASGNDGFNNMISHPACGASSVSVGAVYDANVGAITWSVPCTDAATFADLVICFSNSASILTMLAPGALITAGGESNYAGTSMAAPHVAGAIAVLRAPNAFPSETMDQTVTRMTSTGTLVTDPKNGLVKPRLYLSAAAVQGPIATTTAATNVTASSATLNGTVNPNGLSTSAYFEWGTTTAYGNTTTSQSIGSGASNVGVAANLSGLVANSTYHYRVVATNSTGTSYGSNASFIATTASTNVALASNGGVATASSTYSSAYPVAAVNNNERAGANWANGGGWNDATADAFPDWVQIVFNGSKTIDRVVVYTLQDNYESPVEPSNTLTFSQYGITNYTVQGWNGSAWVTLATITGNNLVKRTTTFSAYSTDRIRINVTNALGSYSRITEVEAWGN